MAMNETNRYQKDVDANPFPNENVDPEVKKKDSYGVKVGKAILYNYLYKRHSTDLYKQIRVNRKYSSGNQDPLQYMPMLDPSLDKQGDGSYLNIDVNISSPVPKFVNVLVGDLINQDYKVQFNSIDPRSQVRRQEKRDELFGKLVRAQVAQQLEAETGIPLEEKSINVPSSKEEIEIHMDLEYKEDIEIAMEEIVDWEFYNNDWNEIKKRVGRDLIENAKGCVFMYFDENLNPRLRYSDIEYIVHSNTEDPAHKDLDYWAEIKMITIRELRNRSNGSLSEEDLFEIAKKSATDSVRWEYGDNFETSRYYNNEYCYDDYRVQIVDFLYWTFDMNNWEWKEGLEGQKYFNKKSFYYKGGVEKSKYRKQKISKSIEMEYSGIYIPCVQKVANYGPSKNIMRVKTGVGRVTPRVVRRAIIFQPNLRYGKSRSIIEQIIPNADNFQLMVLKARQFVAEAVPPGIAVDIDALVEVASRLDGMNKPYDVIKLFKQKGIMVYNGTDMNGDVTNRKVVEAMMNGVGDGLRPFYDAMALEVNQIRELTGINEARDATSPDSKALVGIQKLQLINSNNATRELYQAFFDGIFLRAGERFCRMIQKKAHFEGGIKQYEAIIGYLGVKAIESIRKDIGIAALGVKVEALPGQQEIEQLNIDINTALKAGDITTEDAMEIRRVMNPKKAEKLLVYRKKKRQEAAMEEFRQKEEITAQREAAAAKAAAEAEKIKKKAEADAKAALLDKEYSLKKDFDTHQTMNKLRVVAAQGGNKIDEIEAAAEFALDKTKGTEEVPQPSVFPG